MSNVRRPNRERLSANVTLSRANRENLRLLSRAMERPESRIVDAALRAYFEHLNPVEQAAIERQRTAETAAKQV